MFDIGFSELILITLLALIVLGPKRLPEAARSAGRMVARFRNFIANVRQDFDRELASEDLAELRQLRQEISEARQLLGEPSEKIMESVTGDYLEADDPFLAQLPSAKSTRAKSRSKAGKRTSASSKSRPARKTRAKRSAAKSRKAPKKKQAKKKQRKTKKVSRG